MINVYSSYYIIQFLLMVYVMGYFYPMVYHRL